MADLQKNTQLGEGSIAKLLFKLAAPAVVAQLVNLLYNIVDRIYIGHIPEAGAAALTGVGLFTPILMMITAFAMLAGAGGAPRVAIAMGRKDNDTAEKIVGNCFSLLVIMAAVLTVLFYVFAPQLLRMFGASDVTLPYALQYARIYILGSVFVMIVLGTNGFITAQGFASFAMLTTLIGAVINIALDPLLIFTFGLGVRGAAIATVLSQMVSAVWVVLFLTGKKTILKLKKEYLPLQGGIILPCLALGISTFVMISTESLLSISFNSSLARYGGDIAVGAMTIITSVTQLVNMPLQGLCQGGSPIISYNYGARKPDRVKKTFWYLLIVCVSYSTLFCVLSLVVPQMFAAIFSTDAALIDYTKYAMRIYMAGIFSCGFQLTCQQSFMALSQAKISLLMACLRKLVLLIPLIFLLPLFMANKVTAVFLAEPISDIVAAAVTTFMFLTRFDRILKADVQ